MSWQIRYLLALAVVLFAGVALYLLSMPQQTPSSLLGLSLKIEANVKDSLVRRFGASEEEVEAALQLCPAARWRQIAYREPPGPEYVTAAVGARRARAYYFSCEAGGRVTLYAEVLWKPYLGHDGVRFIACKDDACADYWTAFEHT